MPSTVRDVMTTDIVTVPESAPFKEVAELLTTHRIGALPVHNQAGRVVGMVSEADLLLKQQHPHAEETGSLFAGRRRHGDWRRAEGRRAGSLMTTPPITVAPDTPVAQAARLMQANGVKHLPVVDSDGKLVGIVSRADLLGVFLRGDDAILADLRGLVAGEPGVDPDGVAIAVSDGVVRLTGRVARHSTAWTLGLLARELDGVVGVDNDLSYKTDDVSPRHPHL
jgi:CBS domain-containing protein